MYKVIKEWSLSSLEETVNRYIDEGWLPQGGISTIQGRQERSGYQWTSYSPSGQGTVYVNFIQALIYIGDKDDKNSSK